MQSIICDIGQCGFNSKSGFCLKKVVHIDNQGVCAKLRKDDWNIPVENRFTVNGIKGLRVAERMGEDQEQELEDLLPGQNWQI